MDMCVPHAGLVPHDYTALLEQRFKLEVGWVRMQIIGTNASSDPTTPDQAPIRRSSLLPLARYEGAATVAVAGCSSPMALFVVFSIVPPNEHLLLIEWRGRLRLP
jgi:hypothetical protein